MKRYINLIALAAAVMMLMCACSADEGSEIVYIDGKKDATLDGENIISNSDAIIKTEDAPLVELGRDLSLMSISRYAGAFVEDGTDDIVSDIMSITVRNDGEKAVQYAHITLTLGENTYEFDLTTLPAGASVLLLELSRQAMPEGTDGINGEVTMYALFDTEISMYEDVFSIEATDTAITVTNNSDTDIGQIYVYYKIAYGDLYMGGITYRVSISGLKAGASTTSYAGHYAADYSKLMFVNYAQ